jgi:hypothetical protein
MFDIKMMCENTAAGQHKVSKAGANVQACLLVQCATFFRGQRGITWPYRPAQKFMCALQMESIVRRRISTGLVNCHTPAWRGSVCVSVVSTGVIRLCSE